MSKDTKIIPNHEQIKQIFNDTYNVFYRKWKDISSPEQWVQLMQDMREIDAKYNCNLCRQILLELVKVIQEEFLKKQGGKTDVNTNN